MFGITTATVEYFRRSSDTVPTVERFNNDDDARRRARYLSVDMLATPVVLTDTHGAVARF